METRRLYRNNDFIIVDAGSEREKELLASGWKTAAKQKNQQKGPENSGAEE